MTPTQKPSLGRPLGIQLDQLQLIGGDIGQKRDKMPLCHGMLHSHKLFILHVLDHDLVGRVGLLRLQRRQGDAAAAHRQIPHGADNISANRAYIKRRAEQIGRAVAVFNLLAAEKLCNRHAQGGGEGLQQADVGIAFAGIT